MKVAKSQRRAPAQKAVNPPVRAAVGERVIGDKFLKKIFAEDCMNLMRRMPDDFVAATVTSPPYNKGEQGAVLIKAVKYNGYRDNLNEAEYQARQIAVLDELHRVTAPGGSCFYNHRPRWVKGAPIHPFQWLQKTKWQMRQHLIWNRKICGNLRAWRFYQTHEEIWWLWKDNGAPPGQNQIPMSSAVLGSVWDIRPYSNKDVGHPCIFPPEIPARLILAATKPGDVVFDPFCGCGTTPLAAKLLDREYVACDLSEDYAKISRGRIKTPFDGDREKVREQTLLIANGRGRIFPKNNNTRRLHS